MLNLFGDLRLQLSHGNLFDLVDLLRRDGLSRRHDLLLPLHDDVVLPPWHSNYLENLVPSRRDAVGVNRIVNVEVLCEVLRLLRISLLSLLLGLRLWLLMVELCLELSRRLLSDFIF